MENKINQYRWEEKAEREYQKLQEKMEELAPLKEEYLKTELQILNNVIDRLSSIGIIIHDSGNPSFSIEGFSFDHNGIWVDVVEE